MPGNMFTPIPAVPVRELREYLGRLLDEWEALGDRKWEPANMRGYNFICACQDDLDAWVKKHIGVTENEDSNGGLGPQ